MDIGNLTIAEMGAVLFNLEIFKEWGRYFPSDYVKFWGEDKQRFIEYLTHLSKRDDESLEGTQEKYKKQPAIKTLEFIATMENHFNEIGE